MKKKSTFLFTSALLFVVFANAQKSSFNEFPTYYGKAGISKSIADLPPASPKKQLDSTAVRPLQSPFKNYQKFTRPGAIKSKGPFLPDGGRGEDLFGKAAASSVQHAGLAQQVYSNFLSIDFYSNIIGWPPDPSGAVSNSQIVVSTNNGIAVYDKPGANDQPILTPTGYSRQLAKSSMFVGLDQFFAPVLPSGSYTSDPHVRYDRLTKRWFIVCIEVNAIEGNNAILLAVSSSDKIADTSSFMYYAFNSSLFPYNPEAPYPPFLDYPTLGIDKNSVVIGGNQFGYDSLTNVGYVIDKMKLLHGRLEVKPFELGVYNFSNGTAGGIVTPQGVHNDDPATPYSFFIGENYYNNGLIVATINYDAKKRPHLQEETNIKTGPFNYPRSNSAPGTMVPIDMLDTRLFAAEIHKDKLTGESSLWTAHAIGVNQRGGYIPGTANAIEDSDYVRMARTGSRWYEIGNMYTHPQINQKGTVYDASEPSGRRAEQYFNPSIASSGQGHTVLGGTTDAYNQFLNVFIADRYQNEPEGAMSQPVKVTNTTAIYAPYVYDYVYADFVNRWGDFSQTVVDPWDDQTIWTFQEYADVDDSYGVRVVQVKAPAPAVPLPFGPLSNNADTTIVLQGAAIDGRGFFDPGHEKIGPGYNRLSVTCTGGIMVSNIKFISPTKISFKLNIKNHASGSYTLKVINPDGQSVTTDFIVNASNIYNRNSVIASAADVKNTTISTSSISPNPTPNEAMLQLTAARDFAGKILVLDMNGKVIQEHTYQFIKGANNTSLSLAGLGSGSYIVAVYDNNNMPAAVQKLIKQ